ncbi:universal stress protein [Sphingobium scionense]
MQHILACIDASAYANSVCDLAAWASRRLQLPVELLHVVQRRDAVAARHDLSGAIGLGVKTNLMEELVQLEESDARLQVERGACSWLRPSSACRKVAWIRCAASIVMAAS